VKTLFDGSILIEHLRGEKRATELLSTVSSEERLASVLTRVELEGGMRTAERPQVAALMGVLQLVPVTDGIARRAGEHIRRYRRSHQGIDLVDYVLAATAELQGAELATLNIRHFPMFGRLRPPW